MNSLLNTDVFVTTMYARTLSQAVVGTYIFCIPAGFQLRSRCSVGCSKPDNWDFDGEVSPAIFHQAVVANMFFARRSTAVIRTVLYKKAYIYFNQLLIATPSSKKRVLVNYSTIQSAML